MKKGLIGAVIAAVVLMVLFPACGPSEVKVVEMMKASAPSNVSATFTTVETVKILTIKWEAAENATAYQLCAQQNNVRDIIKLGYYTPDSIFTGTAISSFTKAGNVYTLIYQPNSSELPAGSYHIGISAYGVSDFTQPSGIVWSDYVNISY
jgi:hypothetical protein